MKKQKLLILGAGPFQLGVINRANELGAMTIVLSNDKNDPGHSVADKSCLCSTIDLEGVLEIARSEKVDGVMTAASEVAAVTAGYVSDKLNLENYSHATANTIANKNLLRRFLEANQLPHPRFASAISEEQAVEAFRVLKKPVVVKPATASGSRGVFKVHNEEDLRKVFKNSIAQSILTKEVVIEEFLEGFELGGETIIKDGKIVFMVPTRKYLTDGHVPFCHLLPAGIDHQTRENLFDMLEEVVGLLGLRNGPLNFDVMVHDKKPTIIELGGRMGGNCLPELMKFHTGTDTVSLAVELALGRTPETPVRHDSNPVAAFIIGSSRKGRLGRIKRFDEANTRGTRLVKSHIDCKPDDIVHPFSQGNRQLGYYIFSADETRLLHDAVDVMQQTEWVDFKD